MQAPTACILGLPAATSRSKNPLEEWVEPDRGLRRQEQRLAQPRVARLRNPGPPPDAGTAEMGAGSAPAALVASCATRRPLVSHSAMSLSKAAFASGVPNTPR